MKTKRLYSTKKWKELRLNQLAAEPFCRFCFQLGIRTPANVVDHKVAHKQNEDRFFNPLNLQSLCKTCHDAIKQRYERTGSMIGGDLNGIPFDTAHHWHKQP